MQRTEQRYADRMLLQAPEGAMAAVLVADGIGRGERFAAELNRAGFATLLFDVLANDVERAYFRDDIRFQAERLRDVIEWMRRGAGREMPIALAAGGKVTAGVARLGIDHADLVQAIILGPDHLVSRGVMGQIMVPMLVINEDLFSGSAGRLAARWLDARIYALV